MWKRGHVMVSSSGWDLFWSVGVLYTSGLLMCPVLHVLTECLGLGLFWLQLSVKALTDARIARLGSWVELELCMSIGRNIWCVGLELGASDEWVRARTRYLFWLFCLQCMTTLDVLWNGLRFGRIERIAERLRLTESNAINAINSVINIKTYFVVVLQTIDCNHNKDQPNGHNRYQSIHSSSDHLSPILSLTRHGFASTASDDQSVRGGGRLCPRSGHTTAPIDALAVRGMICLLVWPSALTTRSVPYRRRWVCSSRSRTRVIPTLTSIQ